MSGSCACVVARVVPAVPVLMAEGDVFDVDEDFIGAQAVPDLGTPNLGTGEGAGGGRIPDPNRDLCGDLTGGE